MSFNPKMKAVTLGVGAAMAASGAVMAGAPIAFDSFTVNTGAATASGAAAAAFNVSCPTGWTCSTIATGDAFLQRTITSGGNNYIQTLVTDSQATLASSSTGTIGAAVTAASLPFVTETFVAMGLPVGSNGGAASKTRVGELANAPAAGLATSVFNGTTYIAPVAATTADGTYIMEQTVELLSYAFWTGTDKATTSTINISQVVGGAGIGNNAKSAASGSNATDFFSVFHFREIAPDMGANQSILGVSINTAQLTAESSTSKQQFRFGNRQGSYTTTYANTAAKGAAVLNGVVVTTAAAASVIQSIWIGNDFGAGAFGLNDFLINGGPQAGVDANGVTVESAKDSFAGTGYTAGGAQTGFGWSGSVGTGIYRPTF